MSDFSWDNPTELVLPCGARVTSVRKAGSVDEYTVDFDREPKRGSYLCGLHSYSFHPAGLSRHGQGQLTRIPLAPSKFWMVVRKGGSNPRVQHDTLAKAMDEAKRLANITYENASFAVVEVVALVTKAKPVAPPADVQYLI